MPEPVKNAPKVVYEPKVWTDAPTIEECESDSDNDSVSNVQEDKEKPSFAFTDSVKHVKTSKENVKETGTPNHSPKIEKQDRNRHTREGLGYAFNRKACFDDPHRALKDKGIVDSGCFRHMTGNKAHLADYQEFKGGSVAFGEHFVLPIWSAYSIIVKSSRDKIEKNTHFKTCEKPVSQVEQIFLEELEKLKRQEKEANDVVKSLKKEATHDIQNANTSSTNSLNTISTPLNTVGPSRAFNNVELSYPDDPSMPHLENIYHHLTWKPTQTVIMLVQIFDRKSTIGDHDSSQDPRMDLEGTCGSRRDQVRLPHDSPLLVGHTSDRAKGSLNMEVLYALCNNLSNRVLALETIKDAQAKEILKLKAKIKKLERRCKPSISNHQAWVRSVSLLSKKKKLSKRKFVSKQGRKTKKSGLTKDGSDKLDVELDEDIEYMDTKEALNEGMQSTVSTARPDDDTARPDVSTARQELSTAGLTTTPTTSTIFNDEEITLADTLITLRDDKAKGVAFKYSKSTDRPARSILTLKSLPTIDPKDKGKGVLEEPESAKKMTKSDFNAAQIARDEEIARQLEVELQAELERERLKKINSKGLTQKHAKKGKRAKTGNVQKLKKAREKWRKRAIAGENVRKLA
nr:hypothetical protein [Tanacetum cinerariifolium]